MTGPPPRSAAPAGGGGATQTRLLLVALAAVLAVTVFAALAAEVREGDVFAIDRVVLLAFRVAGHLDIPVGPRWLRESARDITALGGFTVLSLVAAAAIAWLVGRGRRAEATVFAATVVLAQAASEVLKHLIDRPRPDLVPQHDLVYSSSFPSGHALMAPVVYLTLAVVLTAGEAPPAEMLWPLCAAALVVAIGVSRVYLGVHWPTDVLGGWALGVGIAIIATIVPRRVRPR